MEVSLAAAWGFVLVLFRTAALLASAPVTGSTPVPARIRLGLSVAVAFAAFAGAGSPAVPPPETLGGLLFPAAAETAIGLAAGLSARLVLEAAGAAGSMAGLSMGLGYGQLVDPTSGAASSATGEVFALLALAVAVGLGLHREAIAWLCRSVIALPPGGAVDPVALARTVVAQAILSVGLAVRIAFPILAAITFGHVGLAVIGRTAPQVNLQSLGFSVAILCGGGALYLVAPGAAAMAARAALAAFARS
jgi:flagellar biosynthetic protein FliR